MKSIHKNLSLALLGLLLLTSCCTTKPAYQLWEYRVDTVKFLVPPRSGLQEHLNQHGNEGWVLEQFVERGDGWLVVMKRPKQN
jgi:hypothetical protein